MTSRPRSEVYVPSSPTTTGVSNESFPITTTIPLGTTAAQTSIPLVFGTVPSMTHVIATVIDAGTHYSTVITTTRGSIGERDVHLTNNDFWLGVRSRTIPLHEGEEILTIAEATGVARGKIIMSLVDLRTRIMKSESEPLRRRLREIRKVWRDSNLLSQGTRIPDIQVWIKFTYC